MRTTLVSLLAVGTCASVAFAEPLPPTGSAEGVAAGTLGTGPVALTEAEMDQVAAGGVPADRMYINYNYLSNTNTHGNCHRCGSYYIQSVVHQTNG